MHGRRDLQDGKPIDLPREFPCTLRSGTIARNILLFVLFDEGPYADVACLNQTYSFVGYVLCFNPVSIIEKLLFVRCQVKERPLLPLLPEAWQAPFAC